MFSMWTTWHTSQTSYSIHFVFVFRDYLDWSGWKHLGSFSQIIMVPIFSKWPSGHLGSFILWLFWLQAWHILTNRDARYAHDPPIRGQNWVSSDQSEARSCWPLTRWPSPWSPVLTDPVTLAVWAPSESRNTRMFVDPGPACPSLTHWHSTPFCDDS